MNRRQAAKPRQRTGVILIVVLVLVVMISLAGFAFMKRMATEYEATVIGGELRQAVQTLASAETFLVALAEDQAGEPEPGSVFRHDPRTFSARSVNPARLPDGQPETTPTGLTRSRRWRFSVVRRLPDPDDPNLADVMSGPPEMRFGMANESGKLHLGRVMLWEQEEPGSGREALLHIPGMTPEAADSILDWIDEDSQAREFGAEADYYSQLDRPYQPRNGLPETIEELLFVKGVSRQTFYGQTASPQLENLANASWPEMFTVCSAEPNRDRRGESRIDLNELYPGEFRGGAAGSEVSFLPPDLVKYILLLRLYGVSYPPQSGDSNASPGSAVPGQQQTSLSGIELPSESFVDLLDIESLADLFDSAVQLPVAQGGQLISGPLRSNSPDFAEVMRLLEERVTVDFDDRFIGRININTASEPVLLSLIGDAQMVAQIVQQRNLVDAWERETTAWLLTRRILDRQTYRRIYPHITTRGAVHSGEIVVYREFGGPYLRRRLIIDASDGAARRIAWTDYSERGLPVRTSDLRYRGSEFEGSEFDVGGDRL